MNAQQDVILYHYTSLEAFRLIIETGTIRATESKYLNDASELAYGLDKIRESSKSDEISDLIESQFANLNPRFYQYTYIFSLSTEGDLLSQWRAYCPGGGVSIGFSKTALEILAKAHNFEVVRCIYNQDEVNQAVKALVNRWTGEDDRNFFEEMTKLAASIKHPSFAEESEHRLIGQSFVHPHGNGHQRHWRTGDGLLIPFTLISWGNVDQSEPEIHRLLEDAKDRTSWLFSLEPFREIIIGPSAHQNLVYEAVGSFRILNTTYGKHGPDSTGGVTVRKSQIPYRAGN